MTLTHFPNNWRGIQRSPVDTQHKGTAMQSFYSFCKVARYDVCSKLLTVMFVASTHLKIFTIYQTNIPQCKFMLCIARFVTGALWDLWDRFIGCATFVEVYLKSNGTVWIYDKASFLQISWSVKAARVVMRIVRPLGNLTGVSTALLLGRRPNFPLQWRHNGRDSVSNHQPHDCLLNRLFRRRSKKTSKLRGKWPVTRKMFPFVDVIMQSGMIIQNINLAPSDFTGSYDKIILRHFTVVYIVQKSG